MTEQQWMETLAPAERCFPRAVSRHRAIYQGWITTMPREPGEQPKDDSTKEQRERQQRWEENRQQAAEKLNDKYWSNGPS